MPLPYGQILTDKRHRRSDLRLIEQAVRNGWVPADRRAENGISVVLVERADRLARDLIVGELILGQLRDLGVRVVSADGGAELTAGDDDPTRKLIRQVLGAVAEFDKSVTVLKLRAAAAQLRDDR